jgi:hypothetical protein
VARRRLLLLALLVPIAAACTLPGSDAAKTEDCQEGFAQGLLDVPGNPGFESDGLEDRIHEVCKELVAAGLSDDSSDAEFIATLKARPELTSEICEISTEALYNGGFDQMIQAFGGYVTREEAMRLGHDGCVYALTEGYGYVGTGLDLGRLYAAHPELIAPFCRAPLMQAYDQDKPPQPRRLYEAVVTQVCMDGVRTGVIDYGSGSVLSPQIDQKRFRALLQAEWAKRS